MMQRVFVMFLVLIGSQFVFGFCSSPSTQVPESVVREARETAPLSERNWTNVPKCCQLSAEFLGVVVLDQICVSETETRVRLYTKDWKRVCVLKEGMLFRDDLGQEYPFLSAEGVKLCPNRTKMKETPFHLVFGSLSHEAKTFDLIEDKNAKYAHKPWVFEGVDLSRCEWK